MPGLAVLFWLGKQPLAMCPVANPEAPVPRKRPGSSTLPPDFAKSLKFDCRLVR